MAKDKLPARGGLASPVNVDAVFGSIKEGNSLGDPRVLDQLFARYFTDFEQDWIAHRSSKMDKAEFLKNTDQRIERFAKILAGEDPNYRGIKGHHGTAGLEGRFRGDLINAKVPAKLWEKWDRKPYPVLVEWLTMVFMRATEKSGGDEVLFETLFDQPVRLAKQTLLGIEKRMGPSQ